MNPDTSVAVPEHSILLSSSSKGDKREQIIAAPAQAPAPATMTTTTIRIMLKVQDFYCTQCGKKTYRGALV